MEKDFDRWNELKKRLDGKIDTPQFFPKEGVVWMTVLGKNIGYEQNGVGTQFDRPVLVIKKFNNQMYWAVPLSTKQKAFDFYYNFTDPEGKKVSAILAQLRLISIKRFIRDMYEMEFKEFKNIRARLVGFLEEKSKPRTRRGFSRPFGTL